MIRPVVFCHLLLCGALLAQSPSPASNTSKTDSNTAPAQATSSAPKITRSHYHADPLAGHAGRYYRLVWGIESLDVKSAEAGEMIRFSYRVVNADKAKNLNDKRIEPTLIDETTHVKLVVPMMDKVGKLRQTSAPENGNTYWMLFSNKRGYVKRGDHVDIVIGNFHANGLVVD